MTTLKERAEFIGQLSGSAIQSEKDAKRQDARAKLLDENLGEGLLLTDREELRAAMSFEVERRDGEGSVKSMDERGQRKSIETEDARRRYKSIDPKDYAKVQAALEKIMKIKEKMLAAKDDAGNPLFDKADLMTELFAPLVREGLMPENLVIDEHSETAKLLKNTYASYLEMLEEARKERMEKDAKSTVDLHGGGGKLDVLKALGNKAQGIVDHKVGVVAGKAGLTSDEMKRLGSMSVSGAMMAYKGFLVGPATGGLVGAVTDTAKTPSTPTELTLTKDSAKVLYSGIKEGVGIGSVAKGHLDSQKIGSKGNRDEALKQAAIAAAIRIDQAVVDELIAAYPPAMGALDTRIQKAIDVDALVDAVLAEKPQAATFTALVGKAIERELAGVVKEKEAAKVFAKAAKQLATEYASRVNVSALISGMSFGTHEIDNVFEPLVDVAAPAARAVFADPTFREAAKSAQMELIDAAKLNNDEAMTEQLEAAERETEEFERQLVLIDEGGVDMARQRSLAELIGQLEKDRLDLEIVNKVGSLLGSFGMSAVTLGVDSSNFSAGKVVGTLATEVGQSLAPALKAAQLVMQMSVNVIQIARRAEIAAKFEADVKKAQKAGTALLPAIENFYSAKVAQQTFAKIELALQAVQLAGAICASVPEPITMATGKLLGTIGALGAAGNDFAEQVYTDSQLDKGWQRTLSALNNPANRRAGLDALRTNGTLAVHAVAWAAMKNDDPIAKEILRSCGVEAQTLADSASDQKAVINYLETRLHEDIQFKDREKIKTTWAPKSLVLSYPCWFSILNRARTEATPRLSTMATPAVDSAFKRIDLQAKPEVIRKDLEAYSEQQLLTWSEEAKALAEALDAYRPQTTDLQDHTEMLSIRTSLAELARDLKDRLALLAADRKSLQQQPVQPTTRQRSGAVSY